MQVGRNGSAAIARGTIRWLWHASVESPLRHKQSTKLRKAWTASPQPPDRYAKVRMRLAGIARIHRSTPRQLRELPFWRLAAGLSPTRR